MTVSSEFQRFERSLHGTEAPELLRIWAGSLEGPDQERARITLLALLDDPGTDGRIPEALAAVAPEHFATFDALEQAVSSPVGAVKLGGMRALSALTGVGNAPALTGLLAEALSPRVRQDIVRSLAKQPDGRSACLDAMALDDHKDVRSTAFDGLLRVNGLESMEGAAPNVLSMMGIRVRCSLLAVRNEAREEFAVVLNGVDEGWSYIQLGLRVPRLNPVADALRSNLLDAAVPLDVAGFTAIRGESQRWLIDLALGLLDRGDPRVVQALVALRAKRGIGALTEWRKRVGEEQAGAVQAAIEALSG